MPLSISTDRNRPAEAPLRTVPLTAAQPGIWFAEQADPDANAYTVAHYVDIGGALDATALLAAIRAGLAEADVIHALFAAEDETGGPVQQLPATLTPEVMTAPDYLDLRGEADPLAAAIAVMRGDLDTAPRADSGVPLYRHMLLRVGDARWFWYQRYHHIVIDGYGFAALTRRIAAHYEAIVTGSPVRPGTMIDFARIAEERAGYAQSAAFGSDRAFWRDAAAGEDSPPRLGLHEWSGRVAPANADVHRATASIAPDVAARLTALGADRRLGGAEMAMAAILAYLHRMTGAATLSVGVPMMRRMGSVAIDTVGPTVNVLPLRVTVEPRLCFIEVAQRLASALRAMRRHQRYDAEQLQRDLGRIGSGPALYGPTINLKAYDPGVRLAGASTATHVLAAGPVEDLEFGIWSDGTGLVVDLAAHPGLYGAVEIDAHAARLSALLSELVDAPERPLGEIVLGTAAERSAIARWSVGPVVVGPAHWRTALDVFHDHARRDPAATALVDRDGTLDFTALQERVARLAHLLLERGIGAGDIVATALPRRGEAIVALFAVLSTGAAWMPIDPDYPDVRIAAMCADAAPALVLTDAPIAPRFPAGSPLLCLDDPALQTTLARQPARPVSDADRRRPLIAADLAYVIYTSGSTGAPKGVMVPHGGLLNLILSHRAAAYGALIAATDGPVRAAHATSLAFDASWEQIIWLILGHELHLCDEEQRRDAEALVAFVHASRIDAIDLSPSMLHRMLDSGLLDGDHVPRLILCGGEAMPPAVWQRLRAARGLTAINFYGPTEYSVDALGAAVAVSDTPVIGRPIANTQVHVVDDALCPVPIGRPGELMLSGAGLALGYLDRPALTAARFVASPFAQGERMYRTGDLVRWRADGQIEFLGRTDQQVKIRGFRVEPAEVAQVIAALPGVGDALVLARPFGTSRRLVAWFVGTGDGDGLLRALGGTLPDYMLPFALIRVDAWPLTANGKIDHAALPEPAAAPARPITYASDAERRLCTAIAAIVGIERVAPDDDFFALGGDSIGAMALGTAMRREGFALRPRDVFAHRRADRMAVILEPLAPAAPDDAGEPAGELPPLPMQCWFAHHYGQDARFAHAVLLRVPPALEAGHLAAALAALQRAHPLLVARTEGMTMVLPHDTPDAATCITVAPRAPHESESRGALFDRNLADAAARLSPANGRMIEAILFPGNAAEDGWLMIVAHHLVTDGVSWRVLLPELETACRAAIDGMAPTIPREECSVRRWATLLAGQAAMRRSELANWRSVLQTSVRPIATGRIDPRRHTYGTANHRRELLSDRTTRALLDRLPSACHASVEELLLAALHLGAAQVFGTDRLRVAMESHGRAMLDRDTDPSRTVGWLTAEYPVLLDPAATPVEAVRSARQALRSVPDNGIGYGILRWLDGNGQAVLAPLAEAARPEILFNYLGRFTAGSGCWTPVPAGGRFADAFAVDVDPGLAMLHPLEVNAFVDEQDGIPRLAIGWTWADGLIDEAQVEALHAAIADTLDRLDALASEVPLTVGDTLVPADGIGLSEAALADLRSRYGSLRAVLPLLPLQEGLLFHAQLGEAASRYDSVTRIDLTGTLDITRIRAALNAVLRHHPQLAARFDTRADGGPWQVLPSTPDAWPLDEYDLAALPDEDAAARIDALEQAELARTFTVEGGLLAHALLVRHAEERHCLLLNTHHLVVDGWSTPMIVRDVLHAYGEGADRLARPALPYADVVRTLLARDPAPARTAWAQALAGARPTLLFGDERAGAAVSETELLLSPELEAALRSRCRDHGLTLNTIMQGMWGALLSLMTNRPDVLFGTPVSGRTSSVDGIDSHIGLFSNTVPVRVTLDPARPLIAQLRDLQARQAELIEHDGLSLAGIQRLAGGETLFDTLLVSENYPDDTPLSSYSPAGVAIAGVRNRGYTHYPLTLMILPGERLRLLIEHRDVVRAPERLAARLRLILEHIAHGGDAAWATFDPRLPDEIALIAAANATAIPLPAATLRDRLREQAARTPHAPALADERHRLSYAGMREQVVHLAARLADRGVKRGDVVAVALPRSVRLAIAIHAVIEAGAAYLPLDVGYPAERLAMMVEDARPRLVVTEAALAERLRDAPMLLFDRLSDGPAAERESAPLAPDDPAYLIYTSGSTGRPKGALLSHRAIVNRLLWMQHAYPIGAGDRVLQKTPCSFDVSVWEFFWPLMQGAALVMAPPDAHRDPEALAALIADEGITTLHFVPSMLATFLGWIGDAPSMRGPLTAPLRRVFASGEALSVALAARHESLLPHAPLHNLYGPTEAAVDVTYRAASGDLPGAGVPIGRPVWNTQLHMLDHALRPVPPGVPGELYLGGVQLAEGYLGRPLLTASRFVADPRGVGDRLYRTGDLARWTAAGEVEYLGRSDDQLKIRGQRIELGEIEAALLAQPGVVAAAAKACVLGEGTSDDGDARQIVGYVVAADTAAPDPAVLRAALGERLPAQMVPVAIVMLDALPLGPSGKLDRKALPLPLPLTGGGPGRPARPGLESRIATVFARLLELPAVEAGEDFFALGGHSLLAMRLAAELRVLLERPVSVGQIMAAPSVARLAAALSGDGGAGSDAGFGPVLHLRAGRGRPLFCFHPASGFAWQYSGLSRHLPRHVPLIGLQSPRDGGVIAASVDLDAACAAHLATVRAIQPRGPYHLVGYSLGGTLAQGVAARLAAAGEEVAFLGLFDTYPPEGQDWSGATDGEARAEADREREHFLTASDAADAADTAEREAMFAGIVANYADAVRLLAAGRTPRHDGRATLFVATRTLPTGWDVAGCWAPFLAGLDIHCVDCAHEDMLTPAVLAQFGPELAAQLAALPSLE